MIPHDPRDPTESQLHWRLKLVSFIKKNIGKGMIDTVQCTAFDTPKIKHLLLKQQFPSDDSQLKLRKKVPGRCPFQVNAHARTVWLKGTLDSISGWFTWTNMEHWSKISRLYNKSCGVIWSYENDGCTGSTPISGAGRCQSSFASGDATSFSIHANFSIIFSAKQFTMFHGGSMDSS